MKRNKLTICYLADASSIHAQRWVNYFAEQGHTVYLLSFTPVKKEKVKNIRFHLLKNSIPLHMRRVSYVVNLLPNVLQIKKIVRRIHPDVLHAHEAVNYGRFAAFTGFHPFVITPWGTDIFIKSVKQLQKPITRFTLGKPDLITCDGENTRRAMIETFGVNPQKIALIRFGVDTKKFKRMPKDEELKKRLDISDEKIVISLRNLARSHGVATLIEAIPHVLKEIPHTIFIIAGDASYDKEYVMTIKKLVKMLGIQKVTRFIGVLPNDELPRYLNLADVYVSTSLSDSGLASSTAEAMACELPVILSDVGDNKKWIAQSKGGFIYPRYDHRTLAKKIVTILKEKDVRETLGNQNRLIIGKKNNYQREMEKMECLYYALAKRTL